jgi:hypothetical protein
VHEGDFELCDMALDVLFGMSLSRDILQHTDEDWSAAAACQRGVRVWRNNRARV